MNNQPWQTRWPERISYGLSDAADNLVFQMMTMYLLFFYTDIFKLQPEDVAILFVVARFADVIESLLIGIMIDKTKTRWGKSRPFFLWFAFPYVIFAVLTFLTPNFTYDWKLVWAYVTYLGLGFFYTAVNLPITSILPTMTQNDREITLLGVIRQFFGSSVQIIVSVFAPLLVLFFGHGNQQHGYFLTVVTFGIISLVLILNTFFQVKERFHDQNASYKSLKETFSMLKKNHPWIIISIVIFLYWLTTAIKNQTTIYYFKYVIDRADLVPLANSFTLAALVGVVLIYPLSKKLGNKKTMQFGIIFALIGQLILALAVYMNNLPILFTGTFINSIGHGFIVGLVSVMIADTIKLGTAMGIQAEGVLASTDNLGVNLGLGIGGFITAQSFSFSGFVAGQTQNQATIEMINLNYVAIPIILYLIMFAVLFFYNEKIINKKAFN
ncbi:MFS transporter [Lactobacillus sp. YT155]|uniref:MFS transporter n=1 Tax=Lactobacillus sp. YT155 TaxID=3060955 RepID=UPI00265ECDAC|nr:MFS transporter [Lactobacillus sp. YT155]MDO1605836.1 MFS transporter [Lactobacillus sp. YT155]